MQTQSIIAGGKEEAYRGAVARVRAEVEREFMARLKGASLLSQARGRLSIRLEVARRMKRYASSSNLYSAAISAGSLAWLILALGLGAVSCESAAIRPEPADLPAPTIPAASIGQAETIAGRIPDNASASTSGARVTFCRDLSLAGPRHGCILLDRGERRPRARGVSAADGTYSFRQLQEGSFTVRVIAPDPARPGVKVALGGAPAARMHGGPRSVR